MKVLVAQFFQESNSFSNVICGLQKFKSSYYAYGSELYGELLHNGTEVAGALDALQKEGAEIIPSVAMMTCSDGPVAKEAYEHFLNILFQDIDQNQPLDGVFLSLHGATVFEHAEDGMGTLLSDVRKKIGSRVILSASLDYHANVTPKMVQNANILRGYKTYPHADLFEAGFDASKMLADTVNGKVFPNMLAFRIPMIVQSERTQTTSGQMAVIAAMAGEAEKNEEILSVSYFQVQPWLDVSDMGCTIVVIGNNETEKAAETGKKLAKYFWDQKETFKSVLPSFDDVLKIAGETDDVVVVSDPADSTSSGSTGDSNVVLKQYLEKGLDLKAYMLVVDPETVEEAVKTGIGNSGTFQVGGKIYTHMYSPVAIEAKVTRISDGTYTLEGDFGKGKESSMGKSVVLQTGNLSILVMEKAVANNDPGLYLSMGLDPAKAKLVLVKSPTQYRSVFSRYTDKMIEIAAPGASASYFWELPFKKLGRPIYPFDDIKSFEPAVSALGFGVMK